MDKNKILINVIFFIIVFPVAILLYYSYKTFLKEKESVNPLNIYNLQVYSIVSDNNELKIYIYNPNNYSVGITFTYLGLINSYKTSSIVTSGSFIGSIYEIKPNSTIELSYNYIVDFNTKSVIEQWKKLGGSLMITLYYQDIYDKSIIGIINYEVKNIKTK